MDRPWPGPSAMGAGPAGALSAQTVVASERAVVVAVVTRIGGAASIRRRPLTGHWRGADGPLPGRRRGRGQRARIVREGRVDFWALSSFVVPTRDTLLAGRYLLQEEIGSGGMGSVYRATDLRTGGPVAVKLLHPAYTRNATYRERL